MRRAGPRTLAAALENATRGLRPKGLLSRVQSAWPAVVGEAAAVESEPVREHAGEVTVACASATWAQELELLGPELLGRLNAALGEAGDQVTRLRFVVRSATGGPSL